MIRVFCLSLSLAAFIRVCVWECVRILPMDSIKLKDQTELFFAWVESWKYIDAVAVGMRSLSMFNALFKVKLANCKNPQIKEIRYNAFSP